MRLPLAASAAAFVFMSLLSGPAAAISEADARYLMGRVAFGASPADVERLKPLTWEQAVASVLGAARTEPFQAPPDWVFDRPLLPALTKQMRKARRRALKQAGQGLKAWWMAEMVRTPGPAGERMTLFWHNHFTSSLRKVRVPALMYRQNQVLRQHALGNFRDLLSEMVQDPALLLYLDNQKNRKQRPNENLARELMELFTLGEGHYSERDVKEAARALTGLKVRRAAGQTRFARRQHDDGPKTILGRTGRWGADDLVDILLEQPRCAEFLSEKLWRAFVSETPERAEIRRLASVLRDGGWEIRPWVRAMLNGRAFRSTKHRGRLIKSPVELTVGTLRALELPAPDGDVLAKATERMGQDVLTPPNVKGWPGGKRWITSATLLARRQLMQRAGEEAVLNKRHERPGDPAGWLVIAPVGELPAAPDDRLVSVLLDPTWQLK